MCEKFITDYNHGWEQLFTISSIKLACTLKFEIKVQEKDLRENSNPVYTLTRRILLMIALVWICFIYIKSLSKRKILFKTRQNQVDFREFQSSEVDKPVDNCNNFKLRRLQQFLWHWGGSFQINISHGRLASITVILHHQAHWEV